MAAHNDTGNEGEALAVGLFRQKGYEVLATNWRYKNVEIDIVARDGGTLVVGEVKTRKSNYFGEPEAWVTRQKQRNIIRATAAYVQEHNLDLEIRFDIVSIIIGKGRHQINHIPDAFYPLV